MRYLIAFLVVLIVLAIWMRRSESMTRIYRGVGFANSGNDEQVAAGVINSAPVMDMTYTFKIGDATLSCDECPNREVCPNCPQYALSPPPLLEYTTIGPNDQIEPMCGAARGLSPDDVEFASSREMMGAASATAPLKILRISQLDAAKKECHIEHCRCAKGCRTRDSDIDNILYTNAMGLNVDAPLDTSACQFVGRNGYIYNQHCYSGDPRTAY